MFKIRIIYDETIDKEDVPEAVGILCINRRKYIGCSLDNQKIEKFITPFVTNMVFQHIGLFWSFKSNKNLSFYFKNTLFLEQLMAHGIALIYVHNSMVWYM